MLPLASLTLSPASARPTAAPGLRLQISRTRPGMAAVTVHSVPRGTGKGTVTLQADRAPTRSVLRLLLRRNNINYVLAGDVRGQVTASLRAVPFDTALRTLLTANRPALTETVTNGVYLIRAVQTPRSTRTTGTRGFRPPLRRRG